MLKASRSNVLASATLDIVCSRYLRYGRISFFDWYGKGRRRMPVIFPLWLHGKEQRTVEILRSGIGTVQPKRHLAAALQGASGVVLPLVPMCSKIEMRSSNTFCFATDLRLTLGTLLLGDVHPGSWHVGAVHALQAI